MRLCDPRKSVHFEYGCLRSSGNLVAAWIDARTSPARVRAARRPAGGAWSASLEISPAPAGVQSLALSVRPDGFAWAVWGDDTQARRVLSSRQLTQKIDAGTAARFD